MTTSAEPLSADRVVAAVHDAIVAVLEVDPHRIRPETELVDLRADSLALVEIAEIVEETLRPHARTPFRIPDDDLDALRTVGDAVDYVLARL
jgi:acyl carrier protein